MTHSVIIVDDEPPARAKLLRFLEPLPDFRVLAEADTVEAAVAAITAHHPDVVFLDIQLGERSGFDVIEAIRGAESPHIVFSTAYSEYAVQAFDVQALDYLLKPFDRQRFLRSIERVKIELADPEPGDLEERVRRVLAAMPGQAAPIKQILIRDRARAYFIPVDSIERLSAAGNYVEIHAAGKVHLVREPLAKLAAQLDTGEFIRVHRSHVVKLTAIAELQPMFHGDYELILRSGERLALSRRYKVLLPPAIRERL
ncbi:MAG TPA: LytTR family DNA-binding domain-containing protein [Steroidobacteraceae bacterium]|nr:LytTR family DNA-binding domain-containing protein [Steroidobacteraceae bacterium]